MDTFDVEIITRQDGMKYLVLLGADASGEEFADITLGVKEARTLVDYFTRWADSVSPLKAEAIKIPDNLELGHIYLEIKGLQSLDSRTMHDMNSVLVTLKDIRGYLQTLEEDMHANRR